MGLREAAAVTPRLGRKAWQGEARGKGREGKQKGQAHAVCRAPGTVHRL